MKLSYTIKSVSVICCLAIVFMVSGCGKPAPKEVKKDSKIVVWHWMTDRKDAFNELARRYKEETGLDVEFKPFFPPEIYSQKVIAAARAGSLPDIFGIIGEKATMGSFVKAGNILNLTPYMEQNNSEWQEKFYAPTLEVVIFRERNTYDTPPGIYGVPIDTTIMQFAYNKSLLKESGLDENVPPATFAKFIEYAKTVKQKTGVDGFVCGWAEGWLLNCLATEWAINILGEDDFLNTIEGKIPYTDKRWIKVFNLFSDLRKSEILTPNITSLINKEAEDAFSKGKAVFSFNGTWAVNVYKQLACDLDYAFFSLPKVAENSKAKIWGGAGSYFMVNADSANKAEAVKFLKWLTSEKQQQFLIKETSNLPAIKGCEDDLPPILKPLLGEMNNLTHPNVWPYNEDSRVIETINAGLQQIVMGLKTPEQVAREIQDVKGRVCRK